MNRASSPYFRCRVRRAASPPTWACYEQIPGDGYDSSDTGSDSSCSEDEDDYSGAVDDYDEGHPEGTDAVAQLDTAHDDLNMDIDQEGDGSVTRKPAEKDSKGKQRAVDPEPEKVKKERGRRRHRPPVYTLRPILTIQKSQGFVWNQDLFVPPYIKDRYVASTSPPNSRGFMSTSLSSTNSGMSEYEVEVVEIRVNEGDLSQIMP